MGVTRCSKSMAGMAGMAWHPRKEKKARHQKKKENIAARFESGERKFGGVTAELLAPGPNSRTVPVVRWAVQFSCLYNNTSLHNLPRAHSRVRNLVYIITRKHPDVRYMPDRPSAAFMNKDQEEAGPLQLERGWAVLCAMCSVLIMWTKTSGSLYIDSYTPFLHTTRLWSQHLSPRGPPGSIDVAPPTPRWRHSSHACLHQGALA